MRECFQGKPQIMQDPERSSYTEQSCLYLPWHNMIIIIIINFKFHLFLITVDQELKAFCITQSCYPNSKRSVTFAEDGTALALLL